MTAEAPLTGPPDHEDPADLTPLFDESRFVAEVERMVVNQTPRLFAVVQEYGERVDARIAAWGFAFADHAEVVSVDGGIRIRMGAPETVLGAFHSGRRIRAQLVWFTPRTLGHSSGGGAAP